MTPDVLLPVAGVVLSALAALAGVLYTARSVGRANRRTAEIEGQKVELARVESLRQDVDAMRRQRTEDRAEHHAEITSLRNDHAAELTGLRDRVEHLERQRAADRTRLRAMADRLQGWIDYSRLLVQLLTEAGIEHPAAPESDSA